MAKGGEILVENLWVNSMILALPAPSPPPSASKLAPAAPGKFPSSIKVTRKIFLYPWDGTAGHFRMPGLRGRDLRANCLD